MIGTLTAAALSRVANVTSWECHGIEHWRDGAVLTCWHGQIFLAAALLARLDRGSEIWVPIVREYGQSGAMRELARSLGLETIDVPGYERPRERRAKLRTLLPALRAGQSVFMAADGHRPPAFQMRDEPLWLAASAGVPLLPIAFSAERTVTLPTWDRKVIPLPGSRMVARVGEALAHEADRDSVVGQLAALERGGDNGRVAAESPEPITKE